MARKYDNLQTEQTAITLNDKETPDKIRHQSMTKTRQIVENDTEEKNLPTTSIINDIGADLAPISGYATEPLLPLSEACVPLTKIFHNLSFYIQLALQKTPKPPPDGLTIDESAAIRLYTIEWEEPHQSLHSMLNNTLNNANRETLRPYYKYLKLFLTALVKLPCIPPRTIWRGVRKNLSAEYPLDTRVTWWALTSCTDDLVALENDKYLGNAGERTLFSIEVINSRTIRAHSNSITGHELILLPGTQMIVQAKQNPVSDLHVIALRQVIPHAVLMESPFKGAPIYPTIQGFWKRTSKRCRLQ